MHSEEDSSLPNFPTGQSRQPEPTLEKSPGRHGVHRAEPLEMDESPATQLLHRTFPFFDCAFPTWQRAHSVLAVVGANVPSKHGVHFEEPEESE